MIPSEMLFLSHQIKEEKSSYSQDKNKQTNKQKRKGTKVHKETQKANERGDAFAL